METHITVIGQVASDVRFAMTNQTAGDGIPLASFRLASTSRRFDKKLETWVDNDTFFVNVVCFRRLAEHIMSSVKKGDPVIVNGKLRARSWQSEHRSGTDYEIVAQGVGHNLTFGTSMFSKPLSRTPSESSHDNLFAKSQDAESSATMATVSAMPGAQPDIRSVGGQADAGVLPSRPQEDGRSPRAEPSQPSPAADEQAA